MINSRFVRALRMGVSSLLLHKLRSFLTTLGVLFGVASVIAMLAVAEGASEEAQDQIRELGSQNVILRSVKPPEDRISNQETRVLTYGLTHDDLDRIEDTFPGVDAVVPIMRSIYPATPPQATQGHRHLRHLERHTPPMTDHHCADLDQLLPQRRDRQGRDLPKLNRCQTIFDGLTCVGMYCAFRIGTN